MRVNIIIIRSYLSRAVAVCSLYFAGSGNSGYPVVQVFSVRCLQYERIRWGEYRECVFALDCQLQPVDDTE